LAERIIVPRIGGSVLPYYPHHIVPRAHNRQVVFAEPRDFERHLETLAGFKDAYGVKIYAWCLMTNPPVAIGPNRRAGV
jgi:putative transposase